MKKNQVIKYLKNRLYKISYEYNQQTDSGFESDRLRMEFNIIRHAIMVLERK